MKSAYDVDLRALIDVLGTNLYSDPGVHLRELLQNALDAHAVVGAAAEPIDIECDGTALIVRDRGVGMTAERIGDLLGTIGLSSKRDVFGFAQESTIGQFGVGMLSAFLVADRIEVDSRADAAEPVRWSGEVTGRFEVEPGTRIDRGTTVTVVARPDARSWMNPDRVRALAARYVGMHPTPVRVNGIRVNPGSENPFAGTGSDAASGPRNEGALAAARVAFCQDRFGFTPLEMFELADAESELTGIAYILPTGDGLGGRGSHRCYVRDMLVGDVADLVPDWAHFVRVVVNSKRLRLTASREGLVHDDLFERVRESLGRQLGEWLLGLGDRPVTRDRFLAVHEMGIKSIAVSRRELLGFVDRHCVFETNMGPMPLARFRSRFGTLRYTGSVDDYRALAEILANRGVALINAGHSYESSVIGALLSAHPDIAGEAISQQYLLAEIGTGHDSSEHAALLGAAERALLRFDCAAAIGTYAPQEIPAVLLTDDTAQFANDRQVLLAQSEGEPDAWLAALGAVDAAEGGDVSRSRPTLVLNTSNALVRRMIDGLSAPSAADDDTGSADVVRGAVIRTMYGQAVIRAGRVLHGGAAGAIDEALGTLADLATRSGVR